MKTIKTILEQLTEAYDGGFQVDPTYSIDQALSEIQELLDGAKPNTLGCFGENDLEWREIAGYKNGVDQYQENIRKVIQ